MMAQPGRAQDWLPVLVAQFVAPLSAALTPRSNQLRAVTQELPAHQRRALFAHSLMRRQLLT
jgi:hypothetical protein